MFTIKCSPATGYVGSVEGRGVSDLADDFAHRLAGTPRGVQMHRQRQVLKLKGNPDLDFLEWVEPRDDAQFILQQLACCMDVDAVVAAQRYIVRNRLG